MTSRLTATVAVCAMAAVSLAGPDWEEGNQDAGSLPGGAQPARGFGALENISGMLAQERLPGRGTSGDFQDMFLIGIDDPGAFRASMLAIDGGFAQFDAQMFLFFADGRGLLANLDATVGETSPLILPFATDATQAFIPYRGRYLLAVSGAGSLPRSQLGDSQIFQFDDPTEISGPDGPGGPFPVDSWPFPGETGEYLIAVEGAVLLPFGCNFADLAEPFGELSYLDVKAYLFAFVNEDLIVADLAPPFGELDASDVFSFIHNFMKGCQGGG